MAYSISNSNTAFNNTGIKFPQWAGYFRNRITYHILFWVILYLYNTIYIGFIIKNYEYSFYDFSLKLPFIIGICYFNNYYLLPAFVAKKKYLLYLISIFFAILLPTILLQILLNKLVYIDLCPTHYVADALFSYENTLEKMFSITAIVFFTTGLKLSKDWLTQQQTIAEIGSRQLKTELQFLKLQISPHFFFNTLNNLYALVLKKSDMAPEVVLKFSGMVSYLLYESDNEKAFLKKEVEIMQNYLSLEQLRFGDRLSLDFKITGDLTNFNIPPLILLPFIENCFKHGTKNLLEKVEIIIHLTIENGLLRLFIANPAVQKTQQPDKNGGVGLKNAKRRLDLIYGDAYKLDIEEENQQFKVSLTIPSI